MRCPLAMVVTVAKVFAFRTRIPSPWPDATYMLLPSVEAATAIEPKLPTAKIRFLRNGAGLRIDDGQVSYGVGYVGKLPVGAKGNCVPGAFGGSSKRRS